MDKILEFSKLVGTDVVNFQGTGGNISYKKEGFLYIKASGYKIKDIYLKNTLSKVSVDGFFNDINNISNISEDMLSTIIDNNNISNLKPSIETGFHLLINSKYIIHSHNVYINVLLCMKGGENILEILLGQNIDIIEYNSPGLGLFLKMKEKKVFSNIIFLKNHGIIVHGNKGFGELFSIINNIEKLVVDYFKMEKFEKLTKLKKIEKHIFPDTVVIEDIEVFSAHKYIENQIKSIGKEIKNLTIEEVGYIMNMKNEKYRRELFIKKNN